MKTNDISVQSPLRGKEIIDISVVVAFLISIVFSGIAMANLGMLGQDYDPSLSLIQGNSILANSNPNSPVKVKKVKMVITAYSSTPEQTDSTPFVTASGSYVKDGIVANNLLSIGTEVRIPELYGDKVFIVEDRMNSKKGKYHLDIWFLEYQDAKEFGVKTSYVEILES